MKREWKRLTDKLWLDESAVQIVERRVVQPESRDRECVGYFVITFFGGTTREFWGDTPEVRAINKWLGEMGGVRYVTDGETLTTIYVGENR